MYQKQTKGINMDQLRVYNTNRIVNNQFRPILLNLKLLSNPFLKDQQKYHFLIYKLNEYNKRVQNNENIDPYEAMFYERLHSVICDIGFIDSKADQIERLDETLNWLKEQQHLIDQRKDQGYVRYQVTKQSRFGYEPEKKQPSPSQKEVDQQLPSEVIAKEILPFKRKWRTMHKELDIPARRLNQYKRKILNIAPFIQPKEQKKAPRVTYPKIPKLQYNKEEVEQQAPKPEEAVPPPVQGEVKQEENQNAAEQQQQDLGGFGEEKQQPDQEEPPAEDNEDKLAPKIKSYSVQYEDIKRKQYKAPYMFYKGEDYEVQRRMQEKYAKIQNDQLKKQKQDQDAIQLIEQWAAGKSKMEKQHQKRLQNGIFTAQYTYSLEEPPKKQMLSAADELRFGFTQNLIRPKLKQIDLGSSYLPRISQQDLYQKSIRRDRIKSLKSKFSKLLNLHEEQTREATNSLCQYSSRKRGLSEIIRNHSKSKERLNQLDEVARIKQKLARNKVGIDIRSLSMGLCVPEEEISSPDSIFPNKALPSNPYMVETKKKKKKK